MGKGTPLGFSSPNLWVKEGKLKGIPCRGDGRPATMKAIMGLMSAPCRVYGGEDRVEDVGSAQHYAPKPVANNVPSKPFPINHNFLSACCSMHAPERSQGGLTCYQKAAGRDSTEGHAVRCWLITNLHHGCKSCVKAVERIR